MDTITNESLDENIEFEPTPQIEAYRLAKTIIDNVIDPLLEYTIDGRLYSNLEEQIVEILE